ncbi:hypothetical protein [uncultured Shewanella sp.]|uniref:hypothetical protein n=1 Tax=uncultured Shewanella sp. TaxID=173975 RepID=UPI002623D274|nr:hypothetical protein [uncultured Shewanella sp.]
MKYPYPYPYLVLLIFLSSICFASQSKESVSTVKPAASNLITDETHHFSCRNASEAKLNALFQQINSQLELKGVVLYFHGGLSGEDYMQETLGPLLEASLFDSPSLNGYFPIFMNYDAHPLKGGNFIAQLKAAANDIFLHRAAQKFKDKLLQDSMKMKAQKNLLGKITEKDVTLAAKSYLYGAAFDIKNKSQFKPLLVDNDKYYYDILKEDLLAVELNNNLVERDNDFSSIEEDLSRSSTAKQHDEKVSETKGLLPITTSVVIAKSLARIALGINHQIIPTFEEEAFRTYKVGSLSIQRVATNHWNTVKNNAQECFAKNSPGDKLVQHLVERNIPIHTISHSAGAIPTGYLLQNMDKKSKKLASVNLIVPAISQENFNDLYLESIDAAHKVYGYVLSRQQEEDDSIVLGIYPASLLYAVSGVAEGVWYNDKMLMIEQHLKPTRKIYDKWAYKKITGFDSKPVRNYVNKNNDNWYFYPSKKLPYQSQNPGRRASHECTKYPWISHEVSTNIIKNISGISENNIKQPTTSETLEDVKKLNKRCLFIQS